MADAAILDFPDKWIWVDLARSAMMVVCFLSSVPNLVKYLIKYFH